MPSATTCCDPCESPSYTQVPGPTGATGAAGANGTNGVSSFTVTTAQFTMPAEAASVVIAVSNSTWAVVGYIVAIEAGGAFGYFEVLAKTDSTHMTLENVRDTATGVYSPNSAPGTIFAVGATVTPSGLQGIAGTVASAAPVGGTYITQTPDGTLTSEQALSLLATGILRSTTGTGVISIAVDGTHYLSPTTGLEVSANLSDVANAATSRANLGLAIGTNVQAFDATLTSIAALGTAADRYAYTTGIDTWAEGTITSAGRAILDDADAAAQRVTLGVLPGYGLLTSSDTVNLNSATTDTALTVNATRYLIDKVTLENPSAAVTLATAGLFTAAGGGGTTLCADQALNATLTATTKIQHLTKQAIVDTDSRTDGTLYFRVGTAEGAARTVNVKIYGWKYA